ncbi:MAG: XRE family transcriptional regulator [Desertifilum sp.]|nr:XRE family transcriptional regulator [Desertifilum sp.]
MTNNILDTLDMRRLGELLQQARRECGMTQADAAKAIDTARTTMVAIEKGERRLKPTELIKLARAYGRSVSDFVQPRPVVQPFEVQFRAAYGRNELEESQIHPIILRLEKLCRNYFELEKIVDAPLPQNYPREYKVGGMPIEQAAEGIAVEERQRLGLGDGPIPLLRDILEQSVGLRIFYLKMPPKYSEIYSYNEQLGGCMAINAHHPEERRRWSLAHGYLHFLVHRHKPVVDFESEEEEQTFVNYVFELGDDGESATGAIALHRRWIMATDNRRAISFFRREAPRLQILSTLDLMKYWSQAANLDGQSLREALRAIRIQGRYTPPKSHPLYSWWEKAIA